MLENSTTMFKPSQPQKKRLQYKWITDKQKCDLIFRTIYLNENVREVCCDLKINFLTGRNVVQRYKKTGEYCLHLKPSPIGIESANLKGVTRDTNKKISECPLGIILLDDNSMKLVGSKTYKEEDEAFLNQLNNYFITRGII